MPQTKIEADEPFGYFKGCCKNDDDTCVMFKLEENQKFTVSLNDTIFFLSMAEFKEWKKYKESKATKKEKKDKKND